MLQQKSQQRGALHFDFPETKILLDSEGKPIDFKKYERYDSYKIIEEAMVLTNTTIAKMFGKQPFLSRVHESPDPEDVQKFMRIIQ